MGPVLVVSISRTVDPDDSRGQLIELTEAGHTRLVEWRATMARTVGPAFADLGDDDWDVLHHAAALIAARTGSTATGTTTSPTTSTITRTEITA